MITTEKATSSWDLPHAYIEADALTLTCVCQRYSDHKLHSATLREQAHLTPVLRTEKGS